MNNAAFFLIASSMASFMNSTANAQAQNVRTRTAIFAGGCFWCMEKDFEHVPGVVSTQSGYAGGHTENPTYKNYDKGGHIEAVQILFDPQKITYDQLLHTFWRSVDPTDANGQFCDRGHAYSTAIFALNDEQLQIAKQSKQDLIENNPLPNPIVTPILTSGTFWPAEEYHQNYYKKASLKYNFYRLNCGRDKKIRALWGKEAHAGIVY